MKHHTEPHIASDQEIERIAMLSEPILDRLKSQPPAVAINVLIYVATQTMLSLAYVDTKERGPVESWDMVADAIRKSLKNSIEQPETEDSA